MCEVSQSAEAGHQHSQCSQWQEAVTSRRDAELSKEVLSVKFSLDFSTKNSRWSEGDHKIGWLCKLVVGYSVVNRRSRIYIFFSFYPALTNW